VVREGRLPTIPLLPPGAAIEVTGGNSPILTQQDRCNRIHNAMTSTARGIAACDYQHPICRLTTRAPISRTLQIRRLQNHAPLCVFNAHQQYSGIRRRLPVRSSRPIWYTARMPKNKESEFEKLARLIKEEGEDILTDVHDQINGVHVEIGGLRKEMHEGFAAINRRLDQIIQTQLDEHATRIKKLETAVFSK
jgi:hypothetical protein